MTTLALLLVLTLRMHCVVVPEGPLRVPARVVYIRRTLKHWEKRPIFDRW